MKKTSLKNVTIYLTISLAIAACNTVKEPVKIDSSLPEININNSLKIKQINAAQ